MAKLTDKEIYANTKAQRPSLTASCNASGVVSAVFNADKIVVSITDIASGEIATVNTPFTFEILDIVLRVTNGGEVTSKTLTVKNGTDSISSAMSMATDKARVVPTTVDSAYTTFTKDDNNLNFVSSAHAAGDCKVILTILPT